MARPTKKEILARSHYTPLEDLDWDWGPIETETVIDMWEQGEPIDKIARKVKRDIDEVSVLIMDLRRNLIIKLRPGGVYGCFFSSQSQ